VSKLLLLLLLLLLWGLTVSCCLYETRLLQK
jgi:hypothetical protein